MSSASACPSGTFTQVFQRSRRATPPVPRYGSGSPRRAGLERTHPAAPGDARTPGRCGPRPPRCRWPSDRRRGSSRLASRAFARSDFAPGSNLAADRSTVWGASAEVSVRVSIGIDLGSSRVKLLALDEEGNALGVTMASYATESRQPGYAEQNPDRWWDALRLGDVRDAVPPEHARRGRGRPRPHRPDAQRRLPRRRRRAASTRADVVGRAGRGRGGRDREANSARRAGRPNRQPLERELHGTQDHVGRGPRAGGLSPGRAGSCSPRTPCGHA